jgi:Ca2+-binding RTX toxin-like protein
MIGGIGDDTYLVDHTGDKVIEKAGQGTDTVKSKVAFTLGANVENLTLTGTAAINGTGNELGNVIVGNGGANVLDGGTGADFLDGGEGGDTYIFEIGDIATGEIIADSGSTGTDKILITDGLGNFEHIDFRGATISGIEWVEFGAGSPFADFDASQLSATTVLIDDGVGVAIWIYGASDFDASAWILDGPGPMGWIDNNGIWIQGTSAADSIIGTWEADQLIAHSGIDELTGGGGRDQFHFAMGDSAFGAGFRDRVMDFTQGEDLINLTAAFWNFSFKGTDPFSGGGQVEVRYQDDGTNTIIQINTDSNKLVDMEIELANVVLTLTVDDFFFGGGA